MKPNFISLKNRDIADYGRFLRWYATGAGRFSLCGALPFVRERVRAQINYLTMGLFKTNVERVSPTRSIA